MVRVIKRKRIEIKLSRLKSNTSHAVCVTENNLLLHFVECD